MFNNVFFFIGLELCFSAVNESKWYNITNVNFKSIKYKSCSFVEQNVLSCQRGTTIILI